MASSEQDKVDHRSRNYKLHTAIDMTKLRIVADQIAKHDKTDPTIIDYTVQIVEDALKILRHQNDLTK